MTAVCLMDAKGLGKQHLNLRNVCPQHEMHKANQDAFYFLSEILFQGRRVLLFGDHPTLIYLFTHILGEIRKPFVEACLGPNNCWPSQLHLLLPHQILQGFLSLKGE